MKSITILLIVVGIAIFGVNSFAAIPQLLSFQAHLTDTIGQVVADGSYSITARVYDVPTGGSPLWQETHAAVPVHKGYCNLLLGTVTPLPTDLFDGSDRYLAIKIGSDPEMEPRQRITSVGYAFVAAKVDVVNWGDIADIPSDLADGDDVDTMVAYWDSLRGIPGEFLDGDDIGVVSWDTLTAYSDTTHTHDLSELAGEINDEQVPDDITIIYADTANYAASVGEVNWGNIIGIPAGIIFEGDNISMLNNDEGFITSVNWDTLAAYPDTSLKFNFSQIIGVVSDNQVPDDITVIRADSANYATNALTSENADYATNAGSVEWSNVANTPQDWSDGDDVGFQRLRAVDGNTSWLYDSVTFVGGTDITLTQVGDSITISAVPYDDWTRLAVGELYVTDTMDNVGIGTTSPEYKLDVHGDLRVTGLFVDSYGNSGTAGQFLARAGTGAEWIDLPEDDDWYNVYSAEIENTDSIFHMGCVGIGTSSPGAKLQVYDTNSGIVGSNSDYAIYAHKAARGDGNSYAVAGVNTVNPNGGYGAGGGMFTANGTSGTKYGVRGEASGAGDLNYGGYFGAQDASTNYGIYVYGGKSYFADSVGIGTNTPTTKLDINSNRVRIRDSYTPSSSSAPGNTGDICWDDQYIYICIAPNTWKRALIETW